MSLRECWLSINFPMMNRTGVDAAVMPWLWMHLAWQQGRERGSRGENCQKKTIDNPVTLMNRTTIFLSMQTDINTYKSMVLESRCSDTELWNDLRLPELYPQLLRTALKRVYEIQCSNVCTWQQNKGEPVLGQSLVVKTIVLCQCVQC